MAIQSNVGEPDVGTPAANAQTLATTYGAFNIVLWRGRYHGIPISRGEVLLADLLPGDREGLIVGGTVEEAKSNIVDFYGSNHPRQWGAILVESFGAFNIVAWAGRYLGVPHSNGPFDFATDDIPRLQDVAEGDSVAEVKDAILRSWRGSVPHAWGLDDYLTESAPAQELDLPEVVEIEPIHTCNMRCVMCHVSFEKLTHQRIDVARLVSQLGGMKGRWAALASSYEPVAHPEFAELAIGLSEIGMKLDMTTNGSLFTSKLVERVKDCNFRFVTISFDGIRKETYESIRRQANFDRTIERIQNFRNGIQNRDAYFNINQTVMRRNIGEVPESVDYWAKADFDHMGIIFMRVREDTAELRAESLEPIMRDAQVSLDEAARRVIENDYRLTLSSPGYATSLLKARYPEAFAGSTVHSRHSLYRLPINPRTHYQLGEYPGMPVACRSPFKFAKINYDGDVILCQRFKIGNINERSFVDIWYGEKATQVRNSVRTNEAVCATCEHYRFCLRAGEIDLTTSKNFVALTDRTIDFTDPLNIGHFGTHCIYRWGPSYYAIPRDRPGGELPLFDMASERAIYSGTSESEVRAAVEAHMRRTGTTWLADLPEAWESPEILIGNLLGYRVILFHTRGFVLRPLPFGDGIDFLRDDYTKRDDLIVWRFERAKYPRTVGAIRALKLVRLVLWRPTRLLKGGLRRVMENEEGRRWKANLKHALPLPVYEAIYRCLYRLRLI